MNFALISEQMNDFFASHPYAIIVVIIVSIWALIWKGLALWKAARLKQPIWFIILLVVNTAGILEILYIFAFSKIKTGNRKRR